MNNYIDYRRTQIVVSYILMVFCEYRHSQIERTMCALLDTILPYKNTTWPWQIFFKTNQHKKRERRKKGKDFL